MDRTTHSANLNIHQDFRLASDSNNHPDTLKHLASHSADDVKVTLALNLPAESEMLNSPTADPSEQIQANLAKNARCSNYLCSLSDTTIGRSMRLRLATERDAKFILSLRTNDRRNQYVSAVDGDVEHQKEWLRQYKAREVVGEEFYFIIEGLDGESLGTVRIYDFQGESFCWGSWLIKEGAPSNISIESAMLVYETAFNLLKFKYSHFTVHCANERVVAFHKRMGAQIIDSTDLEHSFTYSREAYEAIRGKYAKFLPTRPNADTNV